MAQIYKIYVNESALIVADFRFKSNIDYENIDIQDFEFSKVYSRLKNSNIRKNFLIQTENPKKVYRLIKQSVVLIKAAGGLVRNSAGQYLFIYRLGKWDLPKGKVDPGEKMPETAVREVAEECGIQVDHLGSKILSSYHIYEMKGKVVLKKTNWYHMEVNRIPLLVPQTEENITEARWLAVNELDEVLKNTYPAIKDILEKTVTL